MNDSTCSSKKNKKGFIKRRGRHKIPAEDRRMIFRCLAGMTLLLMVILAPGCEESQIKRAIRSYSGDGSISYLKSPGFLGAPGCSISLPPVNLEDGSHEYSLANIPSGGPYTIYLLIPREVDLEEIHEGVVEYRIDGLAERATVSTSTIANMRKWELPNETHHGLYLESQYFYVYDANPEVVLGVTIKGIQPEKKIIAEFAVRRGGHK